MNTIRPPSLSSRQVLAAVVAFVLGSAVVMFVADEAGGETGAHALSSQSAPPPSAPAAAPAARMPAGAGINAAVGGPALVAEPIVPIEDPLDGVILEAVDPAEALFGDQAPVAVSN